MTEKITSEHVEMRTFKEIVIKPTHGERDTPNFRKSVRRLRNDGHYSCNVLGCQNDDIQVHHIEEFSNENTCDFKKLKEFLLRHDIYGYSKLLINLPIESVDDVRNLMCLCRLHHVNVNEMEGNGTGIHNMTWPEFVAQCVCIEGQCPVPQEGETIQEVLERVD